MVKAVRYKSEGPGIDSLGIYSVAADISVCPGVDSASKNEYQDIPGGKGGRCVRLTALPPSCGECLEIWSLNRTEPSGPHRPVIGVALPCFTFLFISDIRRVNTVKHIQLFQRLNDCINPLQTKRRLLYLKTQFVPRSKHFSSRL